MSIVSLIFKNLGMNLDKDGDLFILSCRWLKYKNQKLNSKEQHYLWSRIGNKIDMKREGGNNGNELNLKLFSLQFLHVGNLQGWDMQNFSH